MKKRTLKGILIMAAMVCTMSIPRSANAQTAEVPVYELESRISGEHLYTTDFNEVQVLSSGGIWENEGVVWYAPTTGTKVYRLNNPNGFHLYTSNKNEIKQLKKLGWLVDNGGKSMFHSGGNVDIYRSFHPRTGIHVLDPDKEDYMERTTEGWDAEGVVMKASSRTDRTPRNNTPTPTDPVSTENSVMIPRDAAIEKALQAAGLTATQARIVKAELDYEDDNIPFGRNPYVYEIEIYSGVFEYDIVIDAVTGKILKMEKEWD